jgi:hypothetical protein
LWIVEQPNATVSGATKALVAMSDFGFGSKAKFRCDQRISAFASKADIVLHVHARCRPYTGRGGIAVRTARTGRCDRPHGREHADRAMGPAMPGTAHFIVSLGAGALVIQTPAGIAADADRLIGELASQTANPPVAAQPVIGRPVTVKG